MWADPAALQDIAALTFGSCKIMKGWKWFESPLAITLIGNPLTLPVCCIPVYLIHAETVVVDCVVWCGIIQCVIDYWNNHDLQEI